MSWFKRGTRTGQAIPSKPATRQPLVLALEPRVMFDGAAVATAAAQTHVVTAAAHASVAAHDTATHDTAAQSATAQDTSHQTPAAEPNRDSSSLAVQRGDTRALVQPETGRNVLFVDARVQDTSELLAHVAPGTEVVYLQQGSDGLDQMRDYLAQHPGAASVQIVAHGNDGDLWLGSTYLSADDIGEHSAELQQIGADIQTGGDILIFACDTAAGSRGAAFVTSLAQLTQRDVAASNDRTGAGSDWTLEVTTGQIEAAPVLSAADEAGYAYDLATITVTSNADSGAGTLRNAITSAAAGDTITFSAGMTISLTSGELAISKNLTIDGDLDGNGTPDVTIDAGYHSRVIDVTSGTVTLDGLTIQHGLLSGAGANKNSSGGSSLGAGISNAGTLTLTDVTVANNYATGGGGSLANGSYAGGGGGGGSGVGSIGGGAGGTTGSGSHTYTGQPGGSGTGGNGGSYNNYTFVGHGGRSTGGGAGGQGGGYANGGAGGSATVGATTIGGGGGGSGWQYNGTTGGNAAGGIYNAGTMFILGSSVVANNGAAAGGGGGGQNGGAGGIAAGGIWNTAAGKVYMTSAAYTAMTGNAAGGGFGGVARSGGGGTNGATGAASARIYNNSGTLDTNYIVDTVTSATYDASTGVLTVTGTNMTTGDTINPAKLTLTGQGGGSYTLTSSSVTASSGTSFSIALNAADRVAVNGLLNKDGTTAVDATTFNLGAATGWDVTGGSKAVADLSGNSITVSNVSSPTITSATYDSSTHVLTVTGTGLVATVGANNDITVSDLTLTGEGGTTYTLTTANVEVTSATSFSVTLNATDRANVETMFNINGTQSVSGTTYNLAAADNWDSVINNADISVATAGVTVANVPVPAITSATYDANTGALVVSGAGFLSLSGATNDIVANKLTFTGDGGATYTLTDTSNVDITSGTSFTLTLSATDRAGVDAIVNKNGTSSSGGTTYNLAAARGWNAGDGGAVDTDLTGNAITVSSVPVPAITGATYDAATGALVVSGTNFLSLSGAANDIVANKLTFKGDGGATYTLTDTSNVDITSGGSFTLTLSATDRAGVDAIVNRNGTSSSGGTTYNLAAAQGWNAGDGGVVDTDLTGNGITVSGVPVPAITSATYDASTGALVVTGTNFLSLSGVTNDIVANKLTLEGDGGATYTLTDTSNVDITSGTSFTLTLSATDRAGVDAIVNKNGTSSSGGTTYNLAAGQGWNAGDGGVVDTDLTGNGITVSGVAVPAITSATYDAGTGALVVTGTGFLSLSGAANDIVANKLTFKGDGGATYTLTDTSNVDITSGTSFTLTLSATDRAGVDAIVNRNGTSSTSGTTYNLAGAQGWNAGDGGVVDTDLTGNGITVSSVPVPAITSATYDASTGALVVTGTGFLSLSGASNDIVANKFTFTGEGGTTYTLTDTSNVDITSGTTFTLSLSATDRAAVDQIINRNGTSSTGGTTYNIAAAEDWAAGADPAVVVADTTGNGVTVSNVAAPTITSATYDASTGALVVTGTGFLSLSGATNDVIASKFTFTGEGGATYTLTDTSNVDITSGTAFTLSLSATDRAAVDQIINRNGTSSTSGTTYNIAAAEDWAAGADAAVVVADTTGNGITVSNVAVPTITSATYDASTGALVVTGTGFLSLSGATNDVIANKFTLTGEGGSTYTLTDTSNVDITSGTGFTLNLSATDKAGVQALFDRNGTSSTSGTTYNLAAAEDWAAGADAAVVVADTTGNGVAVSNVPVPTVTSATYDASTGTLVVTGAGFLSLSGAANDIVANKLTVTGDAGATYTLTNTSNVDISSATSFTLTLSATDRAGVNLILNRNGTSSVGGTTYNLAAAEDWDAGADAAVVIADTTGNGITVGGGNTAPALIDQSPTLGKIPSTQTALPSGAVGTLVSQIINTTGISNFSDPDSGAQVGLAITAADTSRGNWWYTTDNGAHWANVATVSDSGALLLKADANTRLYFQLASNTDGGTAAITFRAWDQTNGTAGTKADASVNGGSTAFSTATDTADVSINASPSVANLNGDSVTFTEGGSAALIDAGSNATVTDTDSPDFSGGNVTVSIVSNRVSTEDVLSVVNQGTGTGQIGVSGATVTYEGSVMGTLSGGSGTNDLVISLNGLATPAATQALVRDIAYSDTNSADPAAAVRSIRVTVNDGDGGISSNADVTAAVIGVNDAPTLIATGASRTFTENGSAVSPFSGVSIDTVESGQSIKTLTFSVSNVSDGSSEIVGLDGSDIALTNGNSVTTATNGLTVDVQLAAGTATVTVASGGGISTGTAETVLDGLTYRNASDAPTAGSRAVTLTSIQDSGGTANGGADTTSLAIAGTVTVVPVDDAPVLTASSGTTAFAEADNATSNPVAVDSGITVSDVDNATLSGATVSVTGNLHSGEDVLAFTNSDSATYGNIGASYDASNGVLTLTSTGSTATLAQWQQALRAVTYTDTSENPSTDARTVSFTVNDGTDNSAAVTKTVSVAAVNEAPVNGVPGPQSLSEGGSLVFSAGNGNQITVSDVDAGGHPVAVTLTATHGTLSLSSLSGLTFSVGTGTGDATMTFQGTMADINHALDGAVFTAANGFSGSASLEVVTNDLGNTGGAPRSDTDSIALTVDRVQPHVTDVSAVTADSVYKIGDTVDVAVTFDSTVTVDTAGGTPTLVLATGTIDRSATYLSGSGTNVLTFRYTVQAGDSSGDLDYVSSGALALNGATIRSGNNEDAVLSLPATGSAHSIAGQRDIVIAGADVAPVILVPGPGAADITLDTGRASGVEPVVLASRPTPPLRVSSVASFDSSATTDKPLVPSTVVPSDLSYDVGLSSGGSFDVPLPQWLSIDFGQWAVFELRSVDGSAAPAWLHFDPVSGTLRGTPPAGMHGSLQLELLVTDGHGVHVSGAIQLHFENTAHPAEAVVPAKPTAREAPAKPSLESQFSQHARGTPVGAQAARVLHLLQGRPARSTSIPSLAAAAASLRQGNLQ